MDAGAPNNRKRALSQLDDAMLAHSTRGPMQSRLRTWTNLCNQWNVAPFSVDLSNLRAVAASLKAAAYRSSELYFDAAVWHQIHIRQEPVPPALRRLIKDLVRSTKRGLPGTKVKAAFPFTALDRLVEPMTLNEPYDATNPAHTVDIVIVAAWFMLREKELAAARIGDVGNTLALCLPLHKTAQGGQVELTRRQLQCACSAVFRPRCPVHAAIRHLRRLRLAGLENREAPFAPRADGGTSTRTDNVDLIRNTLLAAEVPTTFTDPIGTVRQLYGGHACRVAGAQFLAAQGVPISVVQLLGRWSSRAGRTLHPSGTARLSPGGTSHGTARPREHYLRWKPMACGLPPPATSPTAPTPIPDTETTAADTADPPFPPPAPSSTLEPELVQTAVRDRARTDPMAEDPEHFILHRRAHRLHPPDLSGEDFDQLQWTSPCGMALRAHRLPPGL